MFVVFAEGGPRKVSGRQCFVWRGIPSFADVMSRIGDAAVYGMRIEVGGLRLPNDRINTYTGGSGGLETFGSYDGQDLTVGHLLTGAHTRDLDVRRSMLKMTYEAVCKMYFGIVHGRNKGEYGTTATD